MSPIDPYNPDPFLEPFDPKAYGPQGPEGEPVDPAARARNAQALAERMMPQQAAPTQPSQPAQATGNLQLPENLPVTDHKVEDYTKKYNAARQEDEFRAGLANVGRAFSSIPRALGGTQVNDKVYDELGRARAVPAIEQQSKMAQLAEQERLTRAATDPTSRESRAAQALYLDYLNAVAPGLSSRITPEQVSGMSKKQIEEALGGQSKTLEVLERRRHNQAQEGIARERLEIQRGDQWLRTLGVADKLSGAGGANEYRDSVDRGKVANHHLEFVRKVQTPMRGYAASLEAMEDAAPGSTSGNLHPDVKTQLIYDRVKTRAPLKGAFGLTSHALSKGSVAFQAAQDFLRLVTQHKYAGANLTETEKEMWDQMFRNRTFDDPDAAAVAVAFFKDKLAKEYASDVRGIRAYGASLSPDTWRQIEEISPLDIPVFYGRYNPNPNAHRVAPGIGNKPPIPTNTPIREPDPNDPRLAPIPAPDTNRPRATPAPATRPTSGFRAVIVNKVTKKQLETTNPANARRAQQDPDKYEVRILSE